MMHTRREKELEMKERRVRRAEREDAAGKLAASVPDLATLSIAMHETRPDGVATDTHYIRRIMIDSAPALFEVTCSDPSCVDGGYDVTREIVGSLLARRTSFEGHVSCRGRRGDADCARSLRYVTTATFREATQAAGGDPRRSPQTPPFR